MCIHRCGSICTFIQIYGGDTIVFHARSNNNSNPVGYSIFCHIYLTSIYPFLSIEYKDIIRERYRIHASNKIWRVERFKLYKRVNAGRDARHKKRSLICLREMDNLLQCDYIMIKRPRKKPHITHLIRWHLLTQ